MFVLIFFLSARVIGNYDIRCDDKWVTIKDPDEGLYYYNIATWQMQWKQPGERAHAGCILVNMFSNITNDKIANSKK